MITYRSPGKVILSGEHSVVYGQRALCAAIQMWTTVTVGPNSDSNLILIHQLNCTTITITPQELNQNFMSIDDPKGVFLAILMKLREVVTADKMCGLTISIASQIPLGAGLGSSASLALALTAALYHFVVGEALPRDSLLPLAKEVENIFHGQAGSGLDVAISCSGGLLSYQKSEGIEIVGDDIFQRELILLLIDTGVKKLYGTSEVIESVKVRILDLNAASPDSGSKIIQSIGFLTGKLTDQLTINFEMNQLRAVVGENQSLLDDLGVGITESRDIMKQVFICDKHNVACKITGAGMGGFCLAFVGVADGPKLIALREELEQKNFRTFVVQVSKEGTSQVV